MLRIAVVVLALGAACALLLWPRAEGPRASVAGLRSEMDAEASADAPMELARPARSDAEEALPPSTRREASPVPEPPSISLDRREAVVGEGHALLRVRVVGRKSGEPIEGVQLYLVPSDRSHGWSAHPVRGSRAGIGESPTTDADGRAELVARAGEAYELMAQPDSGEGRPEEVPIPALAEGEVREVEVELRMGLDLLFCGRVVDPWGAPAPGARVFEAEPFNPFYGRTRVASHAVGVEREVDPDGTFELLVTSWSLPVLHVAAPGFSPVRIRATEGHSSPAEALAIRLEASARLRVRVTDAAGQVVPGIAVHLTTNSVCLADDQSSFELLLGEDLQWKGTTDPEGACLLEDLPAGAPLSVELLEGGAVIRREREAIRLRAGEERELAIRLGAGSTLYGLVVDQGGEPLRLHAIQLQKPRREGPRYLQTHETPISETRTDPEGRFVFEDVPAGSWLVGPAAMREPWDPSPGRFGVAPLAHWIEVPEGARVLDITLEVHRGLYIHGVVQDTSGQPMKEEVRVTARPEGSSGYSSTRCSEHDGSFAVGPLQAGRYALSAPRFNVESEVVLAEAGDEGVVLRVPEAAKGSISGVVIDGARERSGDAKVLLRPSEGSPGNKWWIGANGPEFAFDELPAGTYDIVARASDSFGVRGGIALAAEEALEGIDVALHPAGRLRIRFDAEDGSATLFIRSAGILVAQDWIGAGGRSLQIVPAGDLIVELEIDGEAGRKVERHLAIAAGEEKELILP